MPCLLIITILINVMEEVQRYTFHAFIFVFIRFICIFPMQQEGENVSDYRCFSVE